MIADTPQPSYYAVIFTSLHTAGDNSHSGIAIKMSGLAKQQPGYPGLESAREELRITVSYLESLKAIKNRKANARHLFAQQQGRAKWYKHDKNIYLQSRM